MTSNTVLLAGSTGMLGARIAHHLLESEDVALRLLVRPAVLADTGKRSGLDPLLERGAEVIEGDVTYTYDCRKKGRIPVREYLMRQGRFAHLIDEDIDYIQKMVDQMWDEWDIPGVAPLKGILKATDTVPAGVS